jgi:hypothetical protein
MSYSQLDSFADSQPARRSMAAAFRARRLVSRSSGGKRVIHLENLRASIICGQQGEKRQREKRERKNGFPIPRQVVTHAVGGLPIADIALQHSVGNRWQWRRKKSNESATVRTELGAAKQPA